MWGLYRQANLWHCRPSELLDIKDGYIAYCLDQAVAELAFGVEAELDKVKAKNDKDLNRKRFQKLAQILGLPDEQRFRSAKPKGR